MKPISLAVTTLLSTFGLAFPTWADTAPGEASQLLIPEEIEEAGFAYDTNRLSNLESEINQGISSSEQNEDNLIRLPNQLSLPEGIRIIETNGEYSVGTEL